MRWRPLLWLFLSLVCFLGSVYFWRLGDEWAAQKNAVPSTRSTNQNTPPATPSTKPLTKAVSAPIHTVSDAGRVNSWPTPGKTNRVSRLKYRLSNTKDSVGKLAHNNRAILLENALMDTARPGGLSIPEHLRAQGDPGSYIVQSTGPLDNTFRALLHSAGATIIAYIPNNAYLVRASADVAQQLQSSGQTAAVLPYEPYYKLKPIEWAVEQKPLPDNVQLNVLLFDDAHAGTLDQLSRLGAEVLSEQPSPFGPVVRVRPQPDSLAAIAGLPGVHEVEFAKPRILANDLSRVTVGVATDTQTPTNYLGLTGQNVFVSESDTGVDTNHPDLLNRVTGSALIDTDGHGTHVAGIIAGDGTQSSTVTNAVGSINPGTNGQYRGKAPKATLFSQDFNQPDYYLQETAARTNALISNNSWTYAVQDYDLAAASYDAAVRDAIPEITGAQPLALVFPAGNGGGVNIFDTGSNDGGTGGASDTIQSPGTAKNVITVGAFEQFRNITNATVDCSTGACVTNQPWLASTDSSDQVAGFSSRGNVGIQIEGDFGRFKPDVVAPGTFIVSTRSSQWDIAAYYNSSNTDYTTFTSLLVLSNSEYNSITPTIPYNAVGVTVTVFPSTPVSLGVSVSTPVQTVNGINQVSIVPSAAELGWGWFVSISNGTSQNVTFDLQIGIETATQNGDFMDVLRTNLNDALGPYYRYESGTSLAAADASGTLALIEEFFTQRAAMTISPALLKALLINGARSLSTTYDFQVQTPRNYQGWGAIFLPTSLPGVLSNATSQATGASSSMFVFDQSPTNALATGQSHTRFFSLSPDGQNQEMRVTLVWTDPPGDPAASIKLVNDLDLVVTNLDTGDVFFGNDITATHEVNTAWNTNKPPNVDAINNVENVYLNSPLGTNYSVTVIGHHVNVNAVPESIDVAQDYALVVSSGDGLFPDAITLSRDPGNTATIIAPNVIYVTNSFPSDQGNPISGGLLLHQHVGASTPLLGTNTVPLPTDANAVITVGMTNQWHFYMLSNDMNFTNASFVTFMPVNLAVPRMGVTNVDNPANATRPEADIDIFVSTDAGLTNLSPFAISNADKSLGRGGTEFVVLSNAQPGAVYYVGVKAEDQQAAEYGFLGAFTEFPPSATDTNGNVYLRGMPVPTVIPPGTPPHPQAALVLAIDTQPIHIQRVVVTNTMTHNNPGKLLGTLSHNRKFAVLNNHTCAIDNQNNCITNIHDYVYEDNGQGDIPFSRPSDGPGSLKDFIGDEGLGVWQLTEVSNFQSTTGVVNRLLIKLEPQNLNGTGVLASVLPNTFRYDSIDVPADATNLTVCVSGNIAPMDLYVRRGELPTTSDYDYHKQIQTGGGCLAITVFDMPPLTAGTYYIGVFNSSTIVQNIRITATIFKNPFAIASSLASAVGPIPIVDNAIGYAYITNLTHMTVSGLDVGLLISDPRISDLAITLISPSGTRVLLFENRGALSTTGLGTFSSVTNSSGLSTFGTTNMTPFYTNNFDDVAVGVYTPRATFDGWSVLSNFATVYPELPAPWLSNNVVILGQSSISNNLPTTNSVDYGLSFEVSHAPYLVGTVGWWPFDGNANDIFSGFDGLLFGDSSFTAFPGKVNQAFFGDGAATRAVVPRAPQLDVGTGVGFTVEGWIFPTNGVPPPGPNGGIVMTNGFEGIPPAIGIPAGSYVDGWLVVTGDVDVLTSQAPERVPVDSGVNCLELNGYVTGAISTNFNTTPGQTYKLSFAYTKNPYTPNPASFTAYMDISLTGQPDWLVSYGTPNSPFQPNWTHTSHVFTASSPVTTLTVTSLNAGNYAMLVDSFEVGPAVQGSSVPATAPLVEWSAADWIGLTNPVVTTVTNSIIVMTNGFEGIPPVIGLPAGNYVDGWLVVTGDVDVLTSGSPQNVPVDSGVNCLQLNGTVIGAISTNFNTILGQAYELDFAYTKNRYTPTPPGFTGNIAISLTGQQDFVVSFSGYLPGSWQHASHLFIASNAVTTLTVTSLNGMAAMMVDSFQVRQFSVTTAPPQGVQLWVSGLPGTNVPGALSVNLMDSAFQSHVLSTPPNLVTNDGWQHVALTYNAATFTARLYVNGALAAAQPLLGPGLFPNTRGHLYFGFDPLPAPNFTAFGGGLDEVGLYNRALSDCEVGAIFHAGSGGKYDPRVLDCPVTNRLQVVATPGVTNTYTFVNGLSSTNGPQWETNTITFTTPNGSTNFTPVVVTALDPNCTVDNFVLSGVLTNYLNGLLHFTEDTNLATVPIKFAPAPYALSNFPPTLVFSNGFENSLPGLYNPGATLAGSTNNPAIGPRVWTVTNGPVSVISNLLVDAVGTNCVALGSGAVQCTLPTVPGGRYRLDYSVRGPGAISWWSGDVEPLSHRAWDLLGGNNGAFANGATNSPNGLVNVNGDANALFFPGVIDPTNNLASKIELGDPANLHLTNGFTIEGWINPSLVNSFVPEQVEQLFFRGDGRQCQDPYWFGLERVTANQLDLVFHIENAGAFDCGIILESANQPVQANQWQHVAAVFEPNVLWELNAPYLTNELRLYVNGQQLLPQNGDAYLEDPANADILPIEFTGRFPFADLDPAYSPGIAIGNRSRADNSEPYHGLIDELTVYGRALTGPEIAAIANAGAAGKADLSVSPNLSLGKVGVWLDDVQLDVGYGDNANWTPHSVEFTADRTNIVLMLQGMLPGTLVDGVALTALPSELNYLPEESLAVLNGEDAYGVWKLEVWDTRTGTNVAGSLMDWQLNFVQVPSNAPPVVNLTYGIPYTNTIGAFGIQNFIVDVPLWATNATNVLLSVVDPNSGNPSTAGVLWSLSEQSLGSTANALFWPPVGSGSTLLSTNPIPPNIIRGQPYYLTITNPNAGPITFAYQVWFDIETLTNCQSNSNFVWQGGIPRYFQFDVPNYLVPPGAPPETVSFYLTGVSTNVIGVRSNLTVVLSQSLPLPDLTHYDYVSSQPDTNNDIIMVVTNTTPFSIRTNRWYVGIFSSASTAVPFAVQACAGTAYPIIIPLTNDVPFVANFPSAFVAPPGPPETFFFEFQITNSVDAVLFEMYNLSGDVDLVLQRDVPPTMAPYFAGSFEAGLQPEQIVLRRTFDVPDLRGDWYLGVFNDLSTNVDYTLRASLQTNGVLLSAQPLVYTLTPLAPPRGSLLQWNSIVGEYYTVENSTNSVNWTPVAVAIRATTTLTTMEVFGSGTFRVRQIPPSQIPTTQLYIQPWTNGLVRISWSTNFPNLTLQFSLTALGPWTDLGLPVTIEGNLFVVYDRVAVLPRFYRLRP